MAKQSPSLCRDDLGRPQGHDATQLQTLHDVQDTDTFCRSTLCHPEVTQWLDAMLVCWGGNVRYHSAFDVSAAAVDTQPLLTCLAVRLSQQFSAPK